MFEDAPFSRYVMYQSIEKWADTHQKDGIPVGKVIGGESPLTRLWPNAHWVVTNYPEVDAMALPYENESLDIILSDQMLEHVKKPWIAADEMLRVLKPGGLLICTTCFMQRWHPPAVYFTFHPDGLRELFQDSLSEIVVGGWGNRQSNDMFNHNPDEKMWRKMPVKDNWFLEQIVKENDPKAPFATWVLGVK